MGKDEIKQEIFCILGVPFLIILFFILLNVLCIYVFHIPNSILETKEEILNEMTYSYNKPRTEKQMLEEILYELKEINNGK